MSWRSLTKIAGSGSISQRYGSADPYSYQEFHGSTTLMIIMKELVYESLPPCPDPGRRSARGWTRRRAAAPRSSCPAAYRRASASRWTTSHSSSYRPASSASSTLRDASPRWMLSCSQTPSIVMRWILLTPRGHPTSLPPLPVSSPSNHPPPPLPPSPIDLKVLTSEIRLILKAFIKERGAGIFRKIRPSPILREPFKDSAPPRTAVCIKDAYCQWRTQPCLRPCIYCIQLYI